MAGTLWHTKSKMRMIWSFPESVSGLLCALHDHLNPDNNLRGEHYHNLHLWTRKQELRDVQYIAHAPQPPSGGARTGIQAVTPMPVSCPRPCSCCQSPGLTVITSQPQESRLPPLLIGPLGFTVRGGNHPKYLVSSLATVTPRSSSNPIAPRLKGPINPLLSGPYRNRPTAPSRLGTAADAIKSVALSRAL